MSAAPPRSITACFEKLAANDSEAVRVVWERYFASLVEVARTQLGGAPQRAFDEEDVVFSVFEALRRGFEEGRFNSMRDRTELWKLLVTITRQKSIDRIHRELTQKRGGDELSVMSVDDWLSSAPTPAELVEMDEQNSRLVSILRDDSLRRVAVRRLKGYTTAEIADQLRVTMRSVERKLRLIRETWQRELDRV